MNKRILTAVVPIFMCASLIAYTSSNLETKEKENPEEVIVINKQMHKETGKSVKEIAELSENGNVILFEADVTRIISGNNLLVSLGGKETRVMLSGIEVPINVGKEKTQQGVQAASFAQEYLEGKKVYLQLTKDLYDQYGRFTAYLWLDIPEVTSLEEIKDKMFNNIIISQGYATISENKSEGKYSKVFKDNQLKAQKASKGLWGKNVETIDEDSRREDQDHSRVQLASRQIPEQSKYIKPEAILVTAEERELLEKLVYAESNKEPFEGMIAVLNVVKNRVDSSYYPNNITDVVFQRSQFTPATNGKIHKIRPNAISKAAVDAFLEGIQIVDNEVLFFVNTDIATDKAVERTRTFEIKIGNHTFFK